MKLTAQPNMEDVVRVVNYNDTQFIKQLTTSTQLGEGHEILLVDATFGAVTLILPPARTVNFRRIFRIKRMDASVNALFVEGYGAETIDGLANINLPTQYDHVSLVTNGTEWFII